MLSRGIRPDWAELKINIMTAGDEIKSVDHRVHGADATTAVSWQWLSVGPGAVITTGREGRSRCLCFSLPGTNRRTGGTFPLDMDSPIPLERQSLAGAWAKIVTVPVRELRVVDPFQ
jgi:hypothetical protein